MSSVASFSRRTKCEHAAAERAKELYWRGPASGIRIADELRRQAIAQRPTWPGPRERAEDHAAHLRALDTLSRVATRAG